MPDGPFQHHQLSARVGRFCARIPWAGPLSTIYQKEIQLKKNRKKQGQAERQKIKASTESGDFHSKTSWLKAHREVMVDAVPDLIVPGRFGDYPVYSIGKTVLKEPARPAGEKSTSRGRNENAEDSPSHSRTTEEGR